MFLLLFILLIHYGGGGGVTVNRSVVNSSDTYLVQVQNYFKQPPKYDPLPICAHRPRILRTIKEHSVTVITAPTGSGKSTRVPQYIMDDEYYSERRHFKIVVTQPRRVAAVALARRVLAERKLDPIDYTTEAQGTLVGYQIGMDKQVNEDTRLTYMTTGVLLRKLCHAGTLNEYTHIILDEVHERDKETDFLLLLVKKFLCSVSKFVKIVVMSATVSADKFSKYFSSLMGGVPLPCPTIEIKEESFRVGVYYLDKFKNSIGYHKQFEDVEREIEPTISDTIYEVARCLLESFDELDRISYGHDDKGSALVFLPGIFEIETFRNCLMKESASKDYNIISLHSSIPRSSQMKVFVPPQPGYRKIILSTNIAESSITVPDIRYVVDFCLSKEQVCDPSSGMTSLRCTWAPRSSLEQRKGRAGRVATGKCYRLISEPFFYSGVSDFTKPEMTRCSLENLILWCKILNIGEPQHMLSLALDPPDLTKLYQSTLILEECGALIRPENDNEPFSGKITFLGQVMGILPLDIRLSRLIMFGYVFNCFTECIVTAACLALPAFLEVPYNNNMDKMKSYVCRMKKAVGTFSDPVMMLHVYNAWYESHCRSVADSRRFCKENFIEYTRIMDVASLVKEISFAIDRFNIPQETIEERKVLYTDSSYLTKLKLALAAANYPNYFVKDKEAIHEESCMQIFGNKSPADTVVFTGMNLDVRSDEEVEKRFVHDVNLFFQQGFCDPVKTLSLEASRLYVTFENSAERSVCKSVYYALKMKKLGFSLTLSDADPRDINIYKDESNYHIPQSKRTIPIIKGEVRVTVAHVDSPTRFFVQFVDSPIRAEWEDTHMRLQDIPRARISYQHLKPKTYAASFFDDEVTLYRVRLEHFRGEEMKISYLDYGNTKLVPVNQLFQIPSELLYVPFQAIQCSLENAEPCHGSLMDMVKGGWPQETCTYVRDVLVNQMYMAEVQYVLNDVVYLDLHSGDQGVTFKEELIRNGRAREAEPDYRIKLARSNTNRSGIRLDTAFTVTDDNYTSPFKRPNFTSKRARLSGGTSPYEVSFKGLCEGLQSKSVAVDGNSVNSVVLHHNTSLKYQELLTASSVALSSGDKIQIRGSTLHDPIPGIAEIMTLLFAPSIQLHCSPGRLNYTGCTAGLGAANGASIWPEHDLNVYFDVRIDNTDLHNINKLRMFISDLLQGDEDNPTTAHLTHQPIRQLQRKIWRLVQVVLQRRRDFIQPSAHINYGWEASAGTHNFSLPGYREHDVMKPLSVLRTPEQLELETQNMHKRVMKLVEENYKIEQTTGTKGTEQAYCALCNLHFRKTIALAAHLNGVDHAAEKLRLDHWQPPLGK